MLLPSSHLAALVIAILSMLCWGLWANTYKASGKWRFELYYFDFAIGVFAAAIIASLTFGTLGFDGFSFTDDLLHASKKQDLQGLAAGMVFNLGNMLLVSAMAVAGMAIAFPLALGVALVIGVFFIFIFRPDGNPSLMFGGAALVLAAVITGVYAYRFFKLSQIDELVKSGKLKSTRKQVSLKGAMLAIFGGIFLGSFLPLLERSQAGDAGLGPYGEAFIFATGIFLSTFFYNLFFMNLPVVGAPLEMLDYFKSSLGQHFMGLSGGVIWFSGLLLALVAARAEGTAVVSPALTYALSQAAPLLAALCGVFLWKEFTNADMRVRALLFVMFALFICGLGMVSIAPIWTRT